MYTSGGTAQSKISVHCTKSCKLHLELQTTVLRKAQIPVEQPKGSDGRGNVRSVMIMC